MGLFGPPIEKIVIEELIRYIHSKKMRNKTLLDWTDDEEGVNIVRDFLDWLHEDWQLPNFGEKSKRPKKAIEADEKLYRKIREYFFPSRTNRETEPY